MTLFDFLDIVSGMKCNSCGFISFRFNKKCPSCNATIKQSKGSVMDEPALSIFGASGMIAGTTGLDHDDMGSLDNDLSGGDFLDNVAISDPENVNLDLDFDLDLSDSQNESDSFAIEEPGLDLAPSSSIPSAPVIDDNVDMQFDVEEEASVDLDDVHVDDMDFDFDSDSNDITPQSIETDDIALSLDEPEEIVADFDLDADSDKPSLDLDTEISFDTEEDVLDIGLLDDDSPDLGLSMENDSDDDSLDLDLDLDPLPEK